MKITKSLVLSAALLTAACGGGGLSTHEAQEAAKARVRQALGLSEEAALFTQIFVGEPLNGDTVLCGRVEGKRPDGSAIPPRRFIAATDPARWVKFEPVDLDLPSRPDKFVEWHSVCLGEAETR